MGKIPYKIINQRGQIQNFQGIIMAKWEHYNNKCFHSNLSYSHSCPIPISLSNLVPIPMGIPREGWGIPHLPFPCTSLLVSISKDDK